MPFVWININEIKFDGLGKAGTELTCPKCGSSHLRDCRGALRRGGYGQRYCCTLCAHTFPDPRTTPEWSCLEATLQQVAGAAWVLGLNTRKIEALCTQLGQTVSRTRIWRTGKALVDKLRETNQDGWRPQIDPIYLPGVSEALGVVIGIAFPTRRKVILGTLPEPDPHQVQTCLEVLLEGTAVQVVIENSSKILKVHSGG